MSRRILTGIGGIITFTIHKTLYDEAKKVEKRDKSMEEEKVQPTEKNPYDEEFLKEKIRNNPLSGLFRRD